MSLDLFGDFPRVPNEYGELRCAQSVLRMVWLILTGEELSVEEADRATGYVAGVETWPFQRMVWLAEHGCIVVNYDSMSTADFAADPIGTLRSSGVGEETLEYFLKITDFEKEARVAQRAVDSPNVEFRVEVPSAQTALDGLRDGWLALVSLDLGTLNGKRDGYQGHAVLATGYSEGQAPILRLQDPGPPAFWDRDVELSAVDAAMRQPSESSGSVTLVRFEK